MTIFAWLLGITTAALFLPVTVLFVQVLSSISFQRRPIERGVGRWIQVAFLVPAHNESAVIAETLAALMPQVAASDRILVVADNCTDDTASIARTAGAEVVERTDPVRRGKGYALDFGLRYLAQNPPEILIIIDADCQVERGSLRILAKVCADSGRPVQALYIMRSPPGVSLKARIAEFAWLVKNQVRPLGYFQLGLPCQLMGTGMAFPWELAARMKLANDHIVEDMKLGVDLALDGHLAIFCPEVQVVSWFPAGEGAAKTQRTRWEHGHMSMILDSFPRLVARSFAKRDVRLLALALDLAVPPLALFVILLVMLLAIDISAVFIGMSYVYCFITTLALGMFFTAILISWHLWGRRILSLTDLLLAPVYVMKKSSLYFYFLVRRQKEWIRTDRDPH